MVDKDLKLVQAIKNVYAESSVLLCWFHVLQSLHRWLNTTGGGGLTGPSNVVQRKAVIDFMRNLKAHATETDFNNAVEAACATIPAKVWKYLKVNWFAIAPMWANFGRRFFHEGCETNNLSERYFNCFTVSHLILMNLFDFRMFLRLKYQFLRGVANRRLDDLLIILSVTVKQYFG
ncbi:hypothetical protein CAPTEDRAFT_124221 [Capitella teleta]|uniref:MULE transposase domain-containing protein n=1 Tax=Capitella teleta TaxID=283909 RepID=R7U8A6_CAPTE|nr:hypothetical protein CAPTEDRAFT_124221 [Capitella teleta]|eukprot:ELT99906.1 hypothetical protein CAPTEDRAFT_124221 [Capitella teleta]